MATAKLKNSTTEWRTSTPCTISTPSPITSRYGQPARA